MSPQVPSHFINKSSPLSSLALDPPVVDTQYSPDAFMVELLIVYNPYPNKDHWAFFIQSHIDPDIGAVIHATGSTKSGFEFEIKRYYDFNRGTNNGKRIPLQLIDEENINEKAMLNNKKYKLDSTPVCKFEMSVCKVAPPEKDQCVIDSSVSFLFPSTTLFAEHIFYTLAKQQAVPNCSLIHVL